MKLPVTHDCLVQLTEAERSAYPSDYGDFLTGDSVFTEGLFYEKVLFFEQCMVLEFETTTEVLPKGSINRIIAENPSMVPIVVCRGINCRMYEMLRLESTSGPIEVKFPLFNNSWKHRWFFEIWLERMGYAPAPSQATD